MPLGTRIYAWLLNLYPARFREEYGRPMTRQFLDEYRDASHPAARAALWLRTLGDLACSIPAEFSRELARDIRYSTRLYRGRAAGLLFAVAALALAIGAGTAVFSVLSALLLRDLPFHDPGRLVELWKPAVGPLHGRAAFSRWQRESRYLESAAAFSTSEMNLTGTRDALRVNVTETSANFFQLLGTRLSAGRAFAPDEDLPGRPGVAVISYSLWQQWFGGAPGVAGALVVLNGAPFTVIGVAPPRFDYPGNTSVWLPSLFEIERVPKRGAFLFQTIGRLKPGVRLADARRDFEHEIRRAAPQSFNADQENRPRLVSLRDQLAGPVRQAGWMLAGLVLLVLLTACANVAQLLLSRTTERRQELAIRSALGASRARLLQQLITEATVVTAVAAALGLAVAHWALHIVTAVAPAGLATQAYSILDGRVLTFAALLALLTGIVFGVTPAWLISRSQPLPSGRTSTPERATRRLRAGLIALQGAITLTLVTSSISIGRTFLQLLHADLGLRPGNVVTLSVSLQGTHIRGSAAEWQYYSEALRRLRAIPGVDAAGAVAHLPLATNIYTALAFKLDSGKSVERVITNAVMPGWFDAVGSPILAGRDFLPAERRSSERPVIVNEAFARAAGLGTAILDRHIFAPWTKAPYLVVGLARTIRLAGPGSPGLPQIYWPVEEEPPPALTFVARTRGRAEAFLPSCAAALRTVDRQVPVYDVKPLDQRLADVLGRPRFYTTATFFLAVLAMLLAVVGIYGAAAYAVAQRRREMGLRMALGATCLRIRAMVVRESLVPIAAGSLAGLLGTIAAGRYLHHLIVNARPADFAICAAGAALLLLAGFISAWLATTRVLAIDPAEALRSE